MDTPTVVRPTSFSPMNDTQRRYMATIAANQLTFGDGPAGTGKTYVAASMAAEALRDGLVNRIVVTRPNVEAGNPMGFLPGELEEKFAPFLEPVREIFEERLGKSFVEYALEHGKIVVRPLSYMRGHTFKNAFVLFDEAQNATPREMYLFLTRIGENAKVVVDGDPHQQDIPGASGFTDAIQRMMGTKSVAHFTFSDDDIVRSGLVREVILKYRTDNDTRPVVPANFEPPAFLTPVIPLRAANG